MSKLARPFPITLLIVLLAGCIVGLSVRWTQPSAAEAALPILFDPPEPEELEVALVRCSLTPEALCAAGASASDTTSLVGLARTHWSIAGYHSLLQADAALAAAKQNYQALRRKVQAGIATEQEVAQLQNARTTLATAEANRNQMVDAAFSAAISGLDLTAQQRLAAIRSNSDQWGSAPVEFRTITRDEEDWIELREALAAERIASQRAEAVDPGAQIVLLQARGNGTVSNAISRLTLYLDDVTSAWEAAIAGE